MGPGTCPAALSVVYLALVVTVGCYLGLFWVLKRLDATFVSMGVIFETVVGVFLGALALGETLGLRVFVGLALVGISIAMVNRRPATTEPATGDDWSGNLRVAIGECGWVAGRPIGNRQSPLYRA